MKIRELKERLDTLFPSTLSESWDNDGDMLCLDLDEDIKGIVTLLDVTDEGVEEAIKTGANLIISHHPMIFNPLKRLDGSPKSKMIAKLIKNGISVFSYHTRFDSAKDGMNDRLAKKIGLIDPKPFGLGEGEEMGRIGDYPECTPEEFAREVSKKLSSPVILYEGKDRISKVALLGGGGKDFIHTAHTLGAHAMITGDVSYGVVTEELPFGITIVDAGHYPTEILAAEAFAEVIEREFGIKAKVFKGTNPAKFIEYKEEE